MKTLYEIVNIAGIYMFKEPVKTLTLLKRQLTDFSQVQVPFFEIGKSDQSTISAYEIEGKFYVE